MTTDELRELAESLGERVNGHPEAVEAVLPRLVAVLEESDDPGVLVAATYALGYVWNPRAVEALLRYVPVDHPDEQVRVALAMSLPGGIGDEPRTAPVRERAVAALVRLTRDPVDDVRDWACFGLGTVEADDATVRDALADRLDDVDDETRAEAMIALAQTGDPRALEALTWRLEDPETDVHLRDLEAAVLLADPALHEGLVALDRAWAAHEDAHVSLLRLALSRCDPAAAERAADVTARLELQLRDLLPPGDWSVTFTGRYPDVRVVVGAADGRTLQRSVFGDYGFLRLEGFERLRRDMDPFEHPTRAFARRLVEEIVRD